MNGEGLVEAFGSLQKLERHYKAQYEEYIAKALAAKENLERLEVLLKDLCSQLPPYPQQQESFLDFEPEPESINGSRKQLELDWMSTLVEDTEPNPEPDKSEDQTENQEISHREFIKLSPQVMPILESLFTQDPGKKLHLSYLDKAVNQKSQLGLSQDTVELFLEEAIALGYCERDNYDKQCYYSISDEKNLFGTQILQVTDEDTLEKQQPNQEESVTLTEANFNHNLPPSPKVKKTLVSTIQGYIIECQPAKIQAQNVIDYLYSEAIQSSWSDTQKSKIRHSIAATLCEYNNSEWRRIETGVYRPLLPPEQKESLAKRKLSHKLPPSPKVKMTVLATILGYLTESQAQTFTAHDVVNYLYSQAEQKNWSKEEKDQVIQAISGSLSSNNKKQWRRIKTGVYQSLLNSQQHNSVSTTDSPTHVLPPAPKVKMTIPDTIMGYILECKPKTFKTENILNYLYSKTEQASWSKTRNRQITHSLTVSLSYYNKIKWQRVRTGVYQPIYPQ